MECISWQANSANRLSVAVFDYKTADPITDALVAVTIYDQHGEELPGLSWPQSLTVPGDATADEAHIYTNVFPSTLEIEKGGVYTATITVTSSLGVHVSDRLIRGVNR